MQGTANGRQWLGGTKVPFTASSPGHKTGEIPDSYPREGASSAVQRCSI